MQTANKLKGLKSGHELEEIAAPILRQLNLDYENFLHTGINREGQTIKDPVDGLVRIEKNGVTNFIYFEFTIDKKLDQKWLNDKKSREGDVIKAAKLANEIKKDFPDAVFRLCLCTNQKVNSKLFNAVEKKCKALGIINDPIIGFSKLLDFLDNTPSGHWIRHKYLGISAELLSFELLKYICSENLKRYKSEINYEQDAIVERTIEQNFKAKIEDYSYSNLFLVGNSGTGKSILTYRVLKSLSKNNLTLRIRNKYVEEANRLDDAIFAQLSEEIPNLFRTYLQDILILINKNKLLIVIEDISRGGNTNVLLNKIISWSSISQGEEGRQGNSTLEASYKIICPIWNKRLTDFQNSNPNKNQRNFVKCFLNRFDELEAINTLQLIFKKANLTLAEGQIKTIAKSLNYDPFLMGIYKELVVYSNKDYLSLSNRSLEKYLEKEVIAIEEISTIPRFEIYSILNNWARFMLLEKKLAPTYSVIKTWFSSNASAMEVFQEINKRDTLFKFDKEGNTLFRHDRVRDSLLINAFLQFLNAPIKNKEILSEPFYADYIGQAVSKSQLTIQSFDFLLENNPLCLFIALQYFDGQKNEYFEEYVVKLKKWVDNVLIKGAFNKEIKQDIEYILLNIDLPEILTIIDNFPYSTALQAARFRNGRVDAGINLIASYNQNEFEPIFTNLYRDELIEIVKSKYYKCVEEYLITSLKVKDFEDQEFFRYSIIILAGYWKSATLSSYILESWKNAKKKEECLEAAIWGIIQSESDDLEEHLIPLLDFWVTCPEPKVSNRPNTLPPGAVPVSKDRIVNYKQETKENLSRCEWDNIKEETIDKLIRISTLNKNYNIFLYTVLAKIDHPKVIRIRVKNLGANYKKAKEKNAGMFFIQYWMLTEKVNPNNTFRPGKQIKENTIEELLTIWSNRNNDDFERTVAFDFWSNNIGIKDLPHLQNIQPSEFDEIYKKAISRRIELGDKTVIPFLPKYLADNEREFHNLDKIWCNDLVNILEDLFIELAEKSPIKTQKRNITPPYFLKKAIKNISPKDAENFLIQFWEFSGNTPDFVQISLLIGTPKLLSMAAKSINNSDAPIALFKYLSLYYGFRKHREENLITLHSIKNLMVYVKYLSMKQLNDIAEQCQRSGFIDYSKRFILPHLGLLKKEAVFTYSKSETEDLKQKFFPSKEVIKTQFKKEAGYESHMIMDNWIHQFERKGISRNTLFDILKDLLHEEPTIKNYRYVSQCIKVAGTRIDIPILDVDINDGTIHEIEKIKKETKYRVKQRVLLEP